MDIIAIVLRTALMYVFIFVIIRLMGKREIGKLSVFDLVISIMIAEIAVFVIETPDKPLGTAITPIIFLAVLQVGIALVALKNNKVRPWVDGQPSVLIRSGRLNRDIMKKQRYNLDDLMMQLREKEITNIDDVELAVLESNGKLSVIRKSEEAGASVAVWDADDEESARFALLPLALIMDGQVQDRNLALIGKTRYWLLESLKSYGVTRYEQVFFCSMDHLGKLYVDSMDSSD